MTDLDDHYTAAVAELRRVGWASVADRFAARADHIDRTATSRAIMAAVDAADCRRAAVVDPVNARRWQAIAKDQAEISRAALALQRVEVEW